MVRIRPLVCLFIIIWEGDEFDQGTLWGKMLGQHLYGHASLREFLRDHPGPLREPLFITGNHRVEVIYGPSIGCWVLRRSMHEEKAGQLALVLRDGIERMLQGAADEFEAV